MKSKRTSISALMLAGVFLGSLAAPGLAADYGGYRPSYQGFGTNTRAAWGCGSPPTIYRVNTLADPTPAPPATPNPDGTYSGSLRAALEASGPKVVVFEKSGTITLQNFIEITAPCLTLAGQTAPSPGINIDHWGFHIKANDVVIQHIRMRYGDVADSTPGLNAIIQVAGGVQNVVLDHVSMAWTMYMAFIANNYEGLPNVYQPDNIAMLDCLIAYGLTKTGVVNGFIYNGMGAAMGHIGSTPNNHYTYARNLFVHNAFRQPILGKGQQIVVNNVVYGADGSQGATPGLGAYLMYFQANGDATDTLDTFASQAVIMNTLTIPSDGTGSGATLGSPPQMPSFMFVFDDNNIANQPSTQIWLSGNAGPGFTGPTGQGQTNGIYWSPEMGGTGDYSSKPLWYASAPDWFTTMNFQVIPSNMVASTVFANAGARPLDRDPVDLKAVSDAQAGLRVDPANMGSRIQSQTDMQLSPADAGGYPVLAVNNRTYNVPANYNSPGNCGVTNTGVPRTNIECDLENMARSVEGGLPLLPSPCDINGDGVTNVVDVQQAVNQALGVALCLPAGTPGSADINRDGVCNVIDVQRVVNAALGGQCVTTP